MSKKTPSDERIPAICALIEIMTSLSVPPPLAPSPPHLQGNPAQLAIDSANSATAIAHAVARLGHPGSNQPDAAILWNETLNQMARIQALYNLPAFPFQSERLPPGAS